MRSSSFKALWKYAAGVSLPVVGGRLVSRILDRKKSEKSR
ncbi:hypothetical protein IMCC20628_03426 [Hoeflea sp. IMCC20628]|nr:hypothetical protein IMCC20628_03426 [Hoeflea sp. IMCC20628]